MDISTIYSKEAVTIAKGSPVKNAAHLMKDLFVPDVIVVQQQSPEGEMPVGILTDRDIATKVIAEGKDVGGLNVEDVMRTDIISVDIHADLVDCLKLMAGKKITRMPVVCQQGNVIGVISVSDILMHVQQVFGVITDVIKSK